MNDRETERITLYTSHWCPHSISVEAFLNRKGVPVNKIAIDGNDEARRVLIELNGGFASVPTLIFPDGRKLTEPSFDELGQQLNLESRPGLTEKIRGFFK